MYQPKNHPNVKVLTGQFSERPVLLPVIMGLLLLLFISAAQASSNVQQELISLIDDVQSIEVEDNAGSYLELADQMLDQERYGQALSYYTKVIRLDRSVDEAFLGRSIAYHEIGRIEDSIADLNVFILRNPNHSMAYVYRGVRYMAQGAIEYAEENLLKAIEINPRNAQAFDDLGVLYAQLGQIDIAMKLFGQALHIDPYNEMAYHNLAIGHYLLEENEKALAAVNRALRLMPESHDSYILKAQILDAMGDAKAADKVRQYAKVLAQTSDMEVMLAN